ncbi:DMT family transporter [Rhizobiaceae bacterium BDR2-2]|uniref:DMT family transporter n=1 Tax=Ectorhizobium quercum TaxID=2965071 RepID=A0AAE3MZU2_9HYPH|nr:DMT family transporter [Ectorhizobium quercum]MCX8997984.1 DMT family transporter [Ectorhizobium quercum]
MDSPAVPRPRALPFLFAFASGGILTLMAHFNGTLGHYGGPFFASWTAHATGTVAAILLIALLFRRGEGRALKGRAPLWAYLGGLSGGLTVIFTAEAVNSPLALSGTLALGLAGQVAFSLAADRWGLFGLARRRLSAKDAASLGLIAAGSALIILFGRVSL